MRPATIRRLLVFGVCMVGVGCLYLVPSMAGAPGRTGATVGGSELPTSTTPTTTTSDTTLVTAISAEPAPASGSPMTPGSGRPPDDRGEEQRSITGRTGATAVEPDREASTPPAVDRLTLVSADAQHLVVSWPEVDSDDLVGYEVWLNGFFVVTVSQPRARLAWFNDSDTHVIQVRALDAAGQEGPSSPTLLVTRPVPAPRPTTSPTAAGDAPAPTTDPSTAPPSDEDAEAPLDQTTAPSAATTSEAGGTEEEHP